MRALLVLGISALGVGLVAKATQGLGNEQREVLGPLGPRASEPETQPRAQPVARALLRYVRRVERSPAGEKLFDTDFHGRITGTDCMPSLGPIRYRHAQVFLCYVNLKGRISRGISEIWCVTIAEEVLYTDRNSTLPCVRVSGPVPGVDDPPPPASIVRTNTALQAYLRKSRAARLEAGLRGEVFADCWPRTGATFRGAQIFRCDVDGGLTGVWCVAIVKRVLYTVDRNPEMPCYDYPPPEKAES